jgi:hypothetical protein
LSTDLEGISEIECEQRRSEQRVRAVQQLAERACAAVIMTKSAIDHEEGSSEHRGHQ